MMNDIPTIYIDAHRLAVDIRNAHMKHAYADPLMSRYLSDIEDELNAIVRNCHLTLTAVDALRELVKARKIGLALSEDNMTIAKSLSNIETEVN